VGGRVDGVEIPDAVNVAAEYPIAVLVRAADHGAAGAFIDFVLSPEGQAIMSEFGFTSP
jgi:molybdate transport system substrate-binding protein